MRVGLATMSSQTWHLETFSQLWLSMTHGRVWLMHFTWPPNDSWQSLAHAFHMASKSSWQSNQKSHKVITSMAGWFLNLSHQAKEEVFLLFPRFPPYAWCSLTKIDDISATKRFEVKDIRREGSIAKPSHM